jgi:pyruvate kinase
MKAKKEEKIARLEGELEAVLDTAKALEERYAPQLAQVHPDQRQSALNLLHYLALRQRDIRELQEDLSALGLSSLGRAEAHVLATVHAVLHALRSLRGSRRKRKKPPVTFKQGRKRLKRHTNALLGKKLKGSSIRIMVTMPTEAAWDYTLVHDMLAAGMNCARINCAHDGRDRWERVAANVEHARRSTGRACRIFMDLAGPKVRTGPVEAGPRVMKVRPEKDVRGRVVTPALVTLVAEARQPEASLPGGGTVIPVSAPLLEQLAAGDVLWLDDARGSHRELLIRSVSADGVEATCAATTYFETGLALRLLRGEDDEGAKGVVGTLPEVEQAIVLRVGDTLRIHKDPRLGGPARRGEPGEPGDPAHISCTLPEALDDVMPGESVLLDDGKIGGVVREAGADGIAMEVLYAKPGGTRLGGGKGINFPESRLRIPALTPKDREDLESVVRLADGVNASFINHPDDVEDLLDALEALGGHDLGLILKIETLQGFQNLPGILLAAMEWPAVGVMIARGDLAVEVGFRHLAQVQEEILWVCEAAHVPVVWATQVLEGLAKKGQATRSEVSDVAMAERAECVLLNKGPYITEAIEALDRIMKSMQAYQRKKATLLPALTLEEPDPEEVGRSVGTRQGRLWPR